MLWTGGGMMRMKFLRLRCSRKAVLSINESSLLRHALHSLQICSQPSYKGMAGRH